MRIFIFTLALIASFTAGWYFSPDSKSSTDSSAGDQSRKALGRQHPTNKTTIPEAVSGSDASITAQLESAFRSGKIGYTELDALFAALTRLSPSTLDEFTTFFRTQSMEKQQLLLWRMFFSAWGKFDPDGAIAFINSRFEEGPARRFFFAAVIDTWSGESMEDAFEFALANFELPQKEGEAPQDSHLAIEYLRELAKENPEEALALAMKLTDAEFVLDMTARRISQLAAEDRNLALEAIEALTGDTHFHAASQYVIDWAKSEPSEAATWLASNFDERFGLHVLGQVARSYVQSDPLGAMKWIETLPDTAGRPEILAEAMKAWAELDPRASAEWLAASGANVELDPAMIALGYQLAKENPQEVIEQWVPRVSDPAKGNELLTEVSSEWQRANPEEFSAWIEQTQALPDEVKQRLLVRESPANAEAPSETGDTNPGASSTGVDQGRDR